MADSGGIANKIDRYFNFNREMPKLSTEVRSHTGGGARKGGGSCHLFRGLLIHAARLLCCPPSRHLCACDSP